MSATYDPADLPDSDDDWERRPGGTPDADLAEAATIICDLLAEAGIGYAIIGGFGMKVRGSDRPTQDVDIAIEAGTTIQQLRAAIGNSTRVRLPSLPNAVYRTLTRISSGVEVQVDLKLATHAGAPESLQGLREVRTFQGRNFVVLTPFAAFCSKLKVYANRGEDGDLQDLRYLITNFSNEIRAKADLLDQSDLSVFVESLSGPSKPGVLEILGLTD